MTNRALLWTLPRNCAARCGNWPTSGLAIVLVTQHLSEIIPEIEPVILLKNGRTVTDDEKSATLTTRNLTEFFGVSVEVTSRGGYFHIP
ncbi:MAG TPA: hypothetical protein VE545_09055 [Candidatus Dormibacteraeota bacterium]|nr:hypothetical protein [Candidatus Dormibacteraeota bacterium]